MISTCLLACWTLALAPADVHRVIDGDTFELAAVPVWPGVSATAERIRVLCVDSPERGEPGYVAAGVFTKQWLSSGPFELETCSRDSFGRLLARITRGPNSLAKALIDAGLATARAC